MDELIIKREKLFLSVAAILGALVVATGAYGAHAGSKFIVGDEFITFIKGIRYQMFHIVGLLAVAMVIRRYPNSMKIFTIAGWLFIAGIILFSGSLYIIVFFDTPMGYITPAGGTSFVLGWLLLAYGVIKG